jgi:hypothetical protein
MGLRHARAYEARMREHVACAFAPDQRAHAGLISVEALKSRLICSGTGECGQNPARGCIVSASDRTSIG